MRTGKRWLWIVVIFALLAIIAICSGCAAKIGPGENGWAAWDVCGWEGGVAAELQVLAVSARLGCTSPSPQTDEEETDE